MKRNPTPTPTRTGPPIFNASPVNRLVAACLIALLAAPLSQAAALPASPQQSTDAQQQLPDAPPVQASAPQPSSPGNASSDQVAGLATPPASPTQQSSQPAAPAQNIDQQNQAQAPVGTAAAPYGKPTGVAGSRPAGAAIAPGKQRRVRAFFIKASIIVAAAAAAGTVIALSHASPSRP